MQFGPVTVMKPVVRASRQLLKPGIRPYPNDFSHAAVELEPAILCLSRHQVIGDTCVGMP